jgi:uncharacterized protein
MTIQDRVYGEISITSPVILDIIQGRSMQRLKGVDQAGYFEPYFPGTKFSRYEHSIGVYWLLKRYEASLPEQIAGLIHDVSHSAFSHCIDYVFDEGSPAKQSHQDNVFAEYVMQSEIPAILEKNGLHAKDILDDARYPLKEKNIPDLCADRLDYALRTGLVFRDLTVSNVEGFLTHLHATDTDWYFDSVPVAQKFALFFRHINDDYFAGIQSAAMFGTLSAYMRYALSKGYIARNDFYTTDEQVLTKIAYHHRTDSKLIELFTKMNKGKGYVLDPSNYEAHILCKSRVVDPLIKTDDAFVRVSDVVPEWKTVVLTELNPKEYFLRFE